MKIVRASSANPPSRPSSVQPPNLSSLSETSSHRPPSSSSSVHGDRPSKKFKADGTRDPLTSIDEDLEDDIRHMQSEADNLRRQSYADTSKLPTAAPAYQFPPSTSKRRADELRPIPDSGESPVIQRNKQLRDESTARHAKQSHGRKSSVSGRGKRLSSSFEATGVIGEYC